MTRPGGALASRPLHFIWIADCSGSMGSGGKIEALNGAIMEATPHMRDVADQNPHAAVLVRAIAFSSGARWHVAQPTPVEHFRWEPLHADGVTDLGAALELVAAQLRMPPMTDRALPPLLVLASDGQPTDDWQRGLKTLMDEPWGTRAVRTAIAIGRDADRGVLQKFIGDPAIQPLEANSADKLVRHIRFVSTAVLKVAAEPRIGGSTVTGSPIPVAATPDSDDASDDVW